MIVRDTVERIAANLQVMKNDLHQAWTDGLKELREEGYGDEQELNQDFSGPMSDAFNSLSDSHEVIKRLLSRMP